MHRLYVRINTQHKLLHTILYRM